MITVPKGTTPYPGPKVEPPPPEFTLMAMAQMHLEGRLIEPKPEPIPAPESPIR